MKWPHKFGDQMKLFDNIYFLFMMKLESGCGEEKAKEWVKEMVEIYGQKEGKNGDL